MIEGLGLSPTPNLVSNRKLLGELGGIKFILANDMVK